MDLLRLLPTPPILRFYKTTAVLAKTKDNPMISEQTMQLLSLNPQLLREVAFYYHVHVRSDSAGRS